MITGSAHPYGTGTIAVSGVLIMPATVSLTGVGTMTAQEAVVPGSTELQGVGTFSFTGGRVVHVLNATAGASSFGEIQAMAIDLSDREIYNDIRAECDIWDILELHPDSTPTYFETKEVSETFSIGPDACEVFHLTTPANEEVYWLDMWISGIAVDPLPNLTQPECEAIEAGTAYQGVWVSPYCYLPPRYSRFRLLDSSRLVGEPLGDRPHDYLNCQIYNDYPSYSAQVTITATYMRLDPDQRYFKLRSTDDTSILGDGRRVMDLAWPLGQTPAQMQEIMDLYKERYSEPVSFVNITMLGISDAVQKRILDFDINEIIQIIHTGLNLNTEFYINNINCRHDVSGCLEASFDLEEVREMEK